MHGFMKASASAIITAFIITIITMKMMLKYNDDNAEVKIPTVRLPMPRTLQLRRAPLPRMAVTLPDLHFYILYFLLSSYFVIFYISIFRFSVNFGIVVYLKIIFKYKKQQHH